MAAPDSQEIARLLAAWRQGDRAVLDQLIPLVYTELRRLARHYLRQERAEHTLQTTEIVHEAYLRLVADGSEHRAPFFAIAAQTMRHLLVDYARRRHRQKRGGDAIRITLNEALATAAARDVELLRLDEALAELSALDAQKSQIVELRYFSGLTIKQTAEVMNLSVRTVNREWASARAWLNLFMKRANHADP